MKQPLNCFRGCCQLSFVESHFPFRKLSIFVASFGFWPCFVLALSFSLGFFVVSFKRHRFSASPSCLWCPLEFLAVAFGTYLFVPDLLAFVALKVLSNNHLHLLVIRFALLFSAFLFRTFRLWFCCLLDFKVLVSTDSHQLGFTDASFRFVPLQRLHRRACQTAFTPPLPISRFSQPLNGWLAFFRFVGLFCPTGTSRVVVFRVLRYIWSVAVSSSLLPSLFTVSFRISSKVCVGSLTSWPLPFVPVSRPRFALAPGSSFPLSWFPF